MLAYESLWRENEFGFAACEQNCRSTKYGVPHRVNGFNADGNMFDRMVIAQVVLADQAEMIVLLAVFLDTILFIVLKCIADLLYVFSRKVPVGSLIGEGLKERFEWTLRCVFNIK